MATPFALANQAATGFSDAFSYDQYRPSYPAQAVEKLLTNLGVANEKNASIVDLGCGTGKFTELLAARSEQYQIVGIEPHSGMRETLERKNLGLSVKILDGDADNMPLKEGWGDSVIAAQAFHWFATEDALKEIHRVLKPGGTFGAVWNVEDYNGPKSWQATTIWEQRLKDIVAELEDGHPRFRHLQWKQVFEKQLDTTPLQTIKDTLSQNLPQFSLPLGEDEVKWTVWLTDEGVWSRYSTLSQIANQEGEKKAEIRHRVLEALKHESTVRNEKGEVAVHGVTHMAWTSRV